MWYNEDNAKNRVDCSVKIQSNGDNFSEDISVGGSCQRIDGGVFVSYVSDGDQSTFFFKQGSAEYVRMGSQYIRMFFEQGKTTRCELGYGNMNGFFEVDTEKIEIKSDENGHRVRLVYKSGQDDRTELIFTVQYK